jgi:hypothetical protein
MKKFATAQCAMAVSLFRGLYARVARNLGVDVSYVSRIARGERKSKAADKALAKEFKRVVAAMGNCSAQASKMLLVGVLLKCPRCKALQEVHIIARSEIGRASGERISCVRCNNRFKVMIPDRIVHEPFPG